MSRKRINLNEINVSISILTALNEFIKKMELEDKSKYTISGYKRMITKFVKVIGGDKEVSKVGVKDINFLIKNMKPTCKNTSINTFLIHLDTFINNFCVKRDYSKGFKIIKLKVEEVKQEVYSKEEIIKLLTKEPNETFMQMQIRIICSVFCSTGLRASELTSLRISDVDLRESIIYTNHTKTGRYRIVPISSSLKPLLTEWIQKRQQINSQDFLFCNSYGEQLLRGTLQTNYYRYAKRKKLEHTGGVSIVL